MIHHQKDTTISHICIDQRIILCPACQHCFYFGHAHQLVSHIFSSPPLGSCCERWPRWWGSAGTTPVLPDPLQSTSRRSCSRRPRSLKTWTLPPKTRWQLPGNRRAVTGTVGGRSMCQLSSPVVYVCIVVQKLHRVSVHTCEVLSFSVTLHIIHMIISITSYSLCFSWKPQWFTYLHDYCIRNCSSWYACIHTRL